MEEGDDVDLDRQALASSLDQTGFLLQRLHELRLWQKEQEQRLVREHDLQREQLQQDDDDDDDSATLDQDLSSLTSFEEAPEDVRPPRLDNDMAVPSWASRKASASSTNTPAMGHRSRNVDELPVGGHKKTFEEILAANLGCAVEQIQESESLHKSPAFTRADPNPEQQQQQQREGSATKPKSFLRKGSGLIKYGVNGSTPQARRSFQRSKSQSHVGVGGGSAPSQMRESKSCSRLDLAERNAPSSLKRTASQKRIGSMTNLSTPTTTKRDARPRTISAEKKNSGKNSKLTLGPAKNPAPILVRDDITISTAESSQASPVHDSVEYSFRERLKNADKKESYDLATFEALEEAACDSSFCSTSSKVKHLIAENYSIPSPLAKPRGSSSSSSPAVAVSSTPILAGGPTRSRSRVTPKSEATCPGSRVIETNQTLLANIQNFLERQGALLKDSGGISSSDSDADDDDDDDDTLRNSDRVLYRQRSDDNDFYDSDGWRSVESGSSDEREAAGKKLRQTVRFKDVERSFDDADHGQEGPREPLHFSPPRIPRNSPSYLIWDIFGKQRRKTSKKQSTETGAEAKPVSLVPMGENDVRDSLLNARLAELESELAQVRKEKDGVQQARRKLQADKKQLALSLEEFEKSKEAEKKKAEEERRRIKRDKAMLEKAQKEKKLSEDKKPTDDVDDLQAKLLKLQDDMQRKECKWSAALAKLQEQVKYLERENQHLHEENHKLKLKQISSKVSTMTGKLAVTTKKAPPASTEAEPIERGLPSSNEAPKPDKRLMGMGMPLRMSFSPADSLDSSVTLVSSGTDSHGKSKAGEGDAREVVERMLDDGSVEVLYPNGNRKVCRAGAGGGGASKVFYYNGDIKETLPDGMIKYHYAQTNTWHITYPDKKEVLQFSNGQEETRYPDGRLEIALPDGTVKEICSDGRETIRLPNNTCVEKRPSGETTLLLPNGEREIHTSEFKRRVYPDGTMKTVWSDGKQETRYADGRIRIKDKQGALLHDSFDESPQH